VRQELCLGLLKKLRQQEEKIDLSRLPGLVHCLLGDALARVVRASPATAPLPGDLPEKGADTCRVRAWLKDVMDQSLTAREQQALVCVHLLNQTQREVASGLCLTDQAFRKLLQRAREKLRQALMREFPEEC